VGQLYKQAFFILKVTVPCSKVKKTRCSQQEWRDLFSAATGVMGDRSLAMTFHNTCSKNIKPQLKITSFSSRHLPQLLKRLSVRFFYRVIGIKVLKAVVYMHAGLLLARGIRLPEVLTCSLFNKASSMRDFRLPP